MEPSEVEVKDRPVEQMSAGSGIEDDIVAFMNPDKEPVAPVPKGKELAKGDEASKVEPVKKEEVAKAVSLELTPEALASVAAKKEPSGIEIPDDLLKDEEVNKLPDKKQREAFIKERSAHRDVRKLLVDKDLKIAELESKAQLAEQSSELQNKVKTLEEQNKKLVDDLSKLDLTRHPEFKKQYDDKMNQFGSRMTQTLVSEGVSQEEAVGLIRALVAEKQPAARERLLDDSAPGLKGTLLAYLTQFDEVSEQRSVALEKARDTAAAISVEESKVRVAAMVGKVDELADQAVAEAIKLGSPYYRTVEGNEAWNNQVVDRLSALKGLLVSGDFSKLAPYVAEGLTSADLRGRYTELLKQHKALEQEYAQVVGQAPAFGKVPPSQAAVDKVKPTLGSGDIVDEAARFLGNMPV